MTPEPLTPDEEASLRRDVESGNLEEHWAPVVADLLATLDAARATVPAGPEPLYDDIERALIGMVQTSWPMDRNAYEKGWNEAIHAARKKVRAVIEERSRE